MELPVLEASEPALPFATNFCIGGVVTFDASGSQWTTAYNPEPYLRIEDHRGEGGPATAGLWRREAHGYGIFRYPIRRWWWGPLFIATGANCLPSDGTG